MKFNRARTKLNKKNCEFFENFLKNSDFFWENSKNSEFFLPINAKNAAKKSQKNIFWSLTDED